MRGNVRRRFSNTAAIFFLAAVFSSLPATAGAQSVAIHVEGNDSARIQQFITRLAPSGVEVLPHRSFVQAMLNEGLPLELGRAIPQAAARGDMVNNVAKAGRAVGVSLVVLARNVKGPKLWLLAINTADGSIAIDRGVNISKRSPRRRGRRRRARGIDLSAVRSALAPLLRNVTSMQSTSAGAGEQGGSADGWDAPEWAGSGESGEPQKESLVDPDQPEGVEKGESWSSKRERADGVAGAFIVVSPIYSVSGRRFSYDGITTSDTLHPYSADLISRFGAAVAAYPLEAAGVSAAAGLSVRFNYTRALAIKSSPENNEALEYTTTWQDWRGGAGYRLTFGETIMEPFVEYGALDFSIDIPSESPLAGTVQSVGYRFARVGSDFRFGQAPVFLGGIAYRQVLGAGPLQDDFFPDASAWGFDAHLGIAYEIFDNAELFLVGSFVQIATSLNPEDGAQYQADSATDRLYDGQLGVTLYY